MQVTPYLHYNGNCEAAFKFYEKELGGKIELLMRYADAPPDMPTTPESKNKVMHARLWLDGGVLLGSDSPPQHHQRPQGFSVTLTVNDPADAERRFNALCKDGNIHMAFAKTFFARGFGMGTDQFGIPWMVISPQEM
jgi:PhnB protein